MKELLEKIEAAIVADLDTKNKRFEYAFPIVLNARNAYEENERDGADYIFNLNSREDVKCCIDGGLTAKEIANTYNAMTRVNSTPYYFFGYNYEKPELIYSMDTLISLLESNLGDVLRNIICFPNACDAYKNMYEEYISHELVTYFGIY